MIAFIIFILNNIFLFNKTCHQLQNIENKNCTNYISHITKKIYTQVRKIEKTY